MRLAGQRVRVWVYEWWKGRASTYTSQRSTSCAVGSSDLSAVGGMERESVAEGVCVVGRWSAKGDGLVGDSGLCDVYGWRLEL